MFFRGVRTPPPPLSLQITHIWASTKSFQGLIGWMAVEPNHYYPMNCFAMWCLKTLSIRIWVLYNHTFEMRLRTQINKFWVLSIRKQAHRSCYLGGSGLDSPPLCYCKSLVDWPPLSPLVLKNHFLTTHPPLILWTSPWQQTLFTIF